METKKDQHHAEMSEFHARNFYSPGAKHFWRYSRSERRWTQSHARKAGVRRRYFHMPEDFEDRHGFENLMAEFETRAKHPIDRMRTAGAALEADDWSHVVGYMAVVRARVPLMEIGSLTRMHTLGLVPTDPRTREYLFGVSDFEGTPAGLSRHARIAGRLHVIRTWLENFSTARRFEVLLAPDERHFIIGDNPVVLMNLDGDQSVGMPLSAGAYLRVYWDGDSARRVDASEQDVAVLNAFMLASSLDVVYSPVPEFLALASDGTMATVRGDVDPKTITEQFAHRSSVPAPNGWVRLE